jgi:hypothetical protein
MNNKSLVEVNKNAKRDKIVGILFLVLGSWVMATSVYLGIAYRLDTTSFIWFNVVFGIIGIVLGFKFLSRAKKATEANNIK